MTLRRRFYLSCAGFFVAPFAWAVHQQVGYMLVPVSCQKQVLIVPFLTLLALALASIGGWLSYRPWRSYGRLDQIKVDASGRTERFIATLSLLFTALSLFAILLQGAGEFFLSACQ